MVQKNLHVISLFVANKPGVLLRIALVFSRRAFNIESLVVSPALDGRFSRMTITASGDKKTLQQIIKQTNKLIDVVHVSEHIGEGVIEKEMALIKVAARENNRPGILQLVEHFKARTVDFSEESLAVEITGSPDKLNAFVDMVSRYGIIEMVRSGRLIITRGKAKT